MGFFFFFINLKMHAGMIEFHEILQKHLIL